MAVETGEEEVVLLRDHSHLLGLLQDLGNVGLGAVQDDVGGLVWNGKKELEVNLNLNLMYSNFLAEINPAPRK